MKSIILFIGCYVWLLVGCSAPSYRLTVSIYGNGSVPGDTVYLFGFDGQSYEKRDSAVLDERQQVVFTGEFLAPVCVAIGVKGKGASTDFILDTTEMYAYNVLLHGKPDFFNSSGYRFTRRDMVVDGGRESDILRAYRAMERMFLARNAFYREVSVKNEMFLDMIEENPDSWALVMILHDIKERFSLEMLGKALEMFTGEDIREDVFYKRIATYRERELKTVIGAVIPDFVLPGEDGEKVSIADYRGKYVLIDFWASWCGPCMGELPNVRKAYELLHDKGLEVVTISTDQKEGAWKEALRKKQMDVFMNLHDTEDVLSQFFNRTAIPFILLLDPEGRIIAKELRGEDIYNVPRKAMSTNL